jgi:hypothetical protein
MARFAERRLFLLVGALLLLGLKSPDALLSPQFWAEDGPIFFGQQFGATQPPLFEPYAGYLNLAPRLVAWGATAVDFSYAPLFYNLSALLVDALCISYATLAFGRYFDRPIVFLSFFVVPSVGDVFGTITNMQWFMQFVLAAACFLPSDRHRQHVPACYLILLIVALSGPFSILVTALACCAIFINKTAHSTIAYLLESRWNWLSAQVSSVALVGENIRRSCLFVVASGACVQLATVFTYRASTPWRDMFLSPSELRGLNVDLVWDRYTLVINSPFSPGNVLILIVLLLTLFAFFAQARRPSLMYGVCILLVLFGVAQPILAFAKQREIYVLAGLGHYYYLLATVAVWMAWHAVVDRWPFKRAIAAAVAACFLIVCVLVRPTLFQRPALNNLAWHDYADAIRAGGKVIVPINPMPWHFIIESHQ